MLLCLITFVHVSSERGYKKIFGMEEVCLKSMVPNPVAVNAVLVVLQKHVDTAAADSRVLLPAAFNYMIKTSLSCSEL